MSTFDKRGETFENKFALEAELRFKAEARRNRIVGLWAAQLLGYEGEAATKYVGEILSVDLEEPGDEDVFRKIRADFDAKGVDQSDHQIRRNMDEAFAEALRQIRAGK